MSSASNYTFVRCQLGRGLPIDFAQTLLRVLDDCLDEPFRRLRLHQNEDSPPRTIEEVVESIETEALTGSVASFAGVTPDERSAILESLSGSFSYRASGLDWKVHGQSLESAESIVDTLSETVEVQLATCIGNGTYLAQRSRSQQRAIRERYPSPRERTLRREKQELFGIAPVHWFGSEFVEAFGGEAVFEQLPDGWAKKVCPGLWKVYGFDDAGEQHDVSWDQFTDRERALIEAFGPQFFFNVETGELATEFVEIPIATQYPVYLWDDETDQLMIHEPDGSLRPAELSASGPEEQHVDAVESQGPPSYGPMVVERMVELVPMFEDDDQLYFVELHLTELTELADVWVEAFSVWLGEYVIKGILDARWVEQNGRWVVVSSRGVFDPDPVVRATVGAQFSQQIMRTAACTAMGIPLP